MSFVLELADDPVAGSHVLSEGGNAMKCAVNARSRGLAFAAFVLVSALAVVSTAGAGSTKWKITQLPARGADYSSARAINDDGDVVGIAAFGGYEHAALWDNRKLEDLGTLGGDSSYATAINNRGQVVGVSVTTEGDGQAFLWEKGHMKGLGTGWRETRAWAINDLGQIVGEGWNPDGYLHGFLWDNGHVTDLGTLGGDYSGASDINNHGQIVGCSYYPERRLSGRSCGRTGR